MPSKLLDSKHWTWGFELEIGDVHRDLYIPPTMGSWEHAETDVVNIYPPYQYVACDPLGLDPPVGGEINVYPGRSIEEIVDRIGNLIYYLRSQGQSPSSSCISHTHVHVHVPGLVDNIAALKRLTAYTVANQHEALKRIHQYNPKIVESKGTIKGTASSARTYLKWDCGRPMPQWMGENIIKYAKTFDDFIRIQQCGLDGKSRGRPFRYCINTYCLKHIQTIEFRLFRHSLDLWQIKECFKFAKHYLESALSNGPSGFGSPKDCPSVCDLIDKYRYGFPPFTYNELVAIGWERTKWSKERGKKERHYIPLD